MKTEAEEGPAGSQVEKASDCTQAVDGGGKDLGTRLTTSLNWRLGELQTVNCHMLWRKILALLGVEQTNGINKICWQYAIGQTKAAWKPHTSLLTTLQWMLVYAIHNIWITAPLHNLVKMFLRYINKSLYGHRTHHYGNIWWISLSFAPGLALFPGSPLVPTKNKNFNGGARGEPGNEASPDCMWYPHRENWCGQLPIPFLLKCVLKHWLA